MKDRIRQIMDERHMTQQEFADYIQINPATLSSIFNERTRPTLNIAEAIKKKIPEIDLNWLLSGEGSMHIGQPSQPSGVQGEMNFEGNEPVLNFDFQSPQPASQPTMPRQMPHYRPENEQESKVIVEKVPRKVTEIRVYYDDQTYETFVPAKSK